MKRFILVMALAATVLSGCGPAATPTPGPTPTPDPCGPSEVTRYLTSIRDVSRRFDDAVALANNTPRMSLPPIVSDLQSIRRAAEDLVVPECAREAKDSLVSYMSAMIDAFMAFLGQQSDATQQAAFDKVRSERSRYNAAMTRLSGGK